MSTFIPDAWYCAGFTTDLKAGVLKSITIMNQRIVFYRQPDGVLSALHDRCPHRFAPLSLGSVCANGNVQCGYHGLQFDSNGQCAHNPHGSGKLPNAAKVRAYPIQEAYGAAWIWMGDPTGASDSVLPDFADVAEREGTSRVEGYLHVRANYQLMIDNLLDLSHVPFLHPFLGGGAAPPPEFRADIRMETNGRDVTAISEFQSMPITPLYAMLWESDAPPALTDMRANIRWSPPSTLMLDTGAKPVGGHRSEGPSAPIAHWLTPETELTTHYFWAASRDRHVGNDEMSAKIKAGVDDAFRHEDEPMIEACQANMGTTDLMSLKPVLLDTDGPSVRARRILSEMIASQHNQTV